MGSKSKKDCKKAAVKWCFEHLGLPIVISFYLMMAFHSYAFMYYGTVRVFFPSFSLPSALLLSLTGNVLLFRTVMLFTLCILFPAGNLSDLRKKKFNFDRIRDNDMKDEGGLLDPKDKLYIQELSSASWRRLFGTKPSRLEENDRSDTSMEFEPTQDIVDFEENAH